MKDQTTIRSLQHYLYCPHRWGLIEINQSWAENYFVTKGNLIHNRTHSGTTYKSKGTQTHTAVKVWNDKYNLVGEVDTLEINGSSYTIVEYKPTMPKEGKPSESDLIQIFAQKLCVDEIFSCDASSAVYYADVKRRVPVSFSDCYEQYLTKIITILKDMDDLKNSGIIPPINKDQNCSGCSMNDICLPKTAGTRIDIRKQIQTIIGDDNEKTAEYDLCNK